ncbi:MAG: ABC transporter permease [Actinomycetota bacterium]|nr:ABC transporter permease [Actinomycetota bacterium]
MTAASTTPPTPASPPNRSTTTTAGAAGTSRPSPVARTREVWRYRELLVNLVRKELKVKYKNSALGFVWSLLNPALYLGVFYVVFQVVLKTGIPDFAIFLLAGLLPWNLFSASLGAATQSIVGNAPLVNKVWFPREILPLAAIGAALVHFVLQAAVLMVAMAGFRHAPSLAHLPVVVLALVVLVVLGAALGIALSAVNVYLRDTSHLLELGLLAWFWVTPIVYQYRLVGDRIGEWALINPVTPIVLAFQRGLFNRVDGAGGSDRLGEAAQSSGILPDESVLWYLRNVAVLGLVSVALLLGALWLFGRLEDDFAEEL